MLKSLVVLVAGFACLAPSQSVKVTERKVAYKFKHPIDESRTGFEVAYPVVTGLSAALNRKVERAISYKSVFDIDVLKERDSKDGSGLTAASFTVGYSGHGVLSVDLSIETMGAYPSTWTKPVVVDLRTGSRVTRAAFTNTAKLVALCRAAQKADVAKAIASRSDEEEKKLITDHTADATFKLKDLNQFRVDPKGVTFVYDYGFVHAIRALQPDGEFFLSWAEMKRFVRRGGALREFVR